MGKEKKKKKKEEKKARKKKAKKTADVPAGPTAPTTGENSDYEVSEMGSPKIGAMGARSARVDFTAKKASPAPLGRTQLNLFLNGLTEKEAKEWSENLVAKRAELERDGPTAWMKS